MNSDYRRDFHQWTQRTQQLIREQRWADIEREALLEELQDMGKSERRAISSQLSRLLLHLLKWVYQPQRRSDSWLDSITDARTQISLTIQDSPSLNSLPAEQLARCYQRARGAAARQTGLGLEVFPTDCPFPIEDVLDEDWLP